MFNINDYYLGIIIAHPSYFRNPESKKRCVENVESDPFHLLTFEQSIIIGTATLLRKKDGNYYDEYYSRYSNELCYQEKKTNRYGITLAYLKPLSEYCVEETAIYDSEGLLKDVDLIEDTLTHSYYVVYSRLTREYNVVINDDDILSFVKEDYLSELMGEKNFEKMIQKSKRR